MSVSIKREAKLEGESPSEEKAEKAAGEPMYDKESDIPKEHDGVDVSEEFQTKAHHLVHKASKHELHHLRRKMDDRHDVLREEERKAEETKKAKGGEKPKMVHLSSLKVQAPPEQYSTDTAPAGLDM
jgi:cell envelope opacity-associated protein A